MTERSAVRVPGGGGGRRRGLRRRGGLTQRDELQGRIHGPAHQLSERALVLATFGHRREHVFATLRFPSDGKLGGSGILGPEIWIPRRRAENSLWACNRTCRGPISVPVLGPLAELDLVRLAAERVGELVVQAVGGARDLVEGVDQLDGLQGVPEQVVAGDQDP